MPQKYGCARIKSSKKHKAHDETESEINSLSSFVIKNDETSVMNWLFAPFYIEHNIPLIVSDYVRNLFRLKLPDCKTE